MSETGKKVKSSAKGKHKDKPEKKKKSKKKVKKPMDDEDGTAEKPVVIASSSKRKRKRRRRSATSSAPDEVSEKALKALTQRTVEFFTFIFPYDLKTRNKTSFTIRPRRLASLRSSSGSIVREAIKDEAVPTKFAALVTAWRHLNGPPTGPVAAAKGKGGKKKAPPPEPMTGTAAMLATTGPAFIATLPDHAANLIIDLLTTLLPKPPMAWASKAGLETWQSSEAAVPSFGEPTLLWLGCTVLTRLAGGIYPFCPQTAAWHCVVYHLLLQTLTLTKPIKIDDWAAATVVRSLGLSGGAVRGGSTKLASAVSVLASAFADEETGTGSSKKRKRAEMEEEEDCDDGDDEEDDEEDEEDGGDVDSD